jgi:hypothetical protein
MTRLIMTIIVLLMFATSSSARSTYNNSKQCVLSSIVNAQQLGIDFGKYMQRKVHIPYLANRIAYKPGGSRQPNKEEVRIKRKFRYGKPGPAFANIDAETVAFFQRRSRLINLPVGPNRTKIPVFELVGSYQSLRARKTYRFVLWITFQNDKCELVDVNWNGLLWSKFL